MLETSPDPGKSKRDVLLTMALVASMGLLVLLGWHVHSRALVQLLPGMVPMQYNAALCFLVLAATGVVVAEQRLPCRLGGLGALFLVAMGGSAMYQHLAYRPLGINSFFFTQWDVASPVFPGLMAAPTAFCFLLGGLGILFFNLCSRWYMGLASTSIVLFCIGLASLLTLLLGKTHVFPFGLGHQMAPQTALAFTLWGGVMARYAWRQESRKIDGIPDWAPLMGSLGVGTLLLALGVVLQHDKGVSAIALGVFGMVSTALVGLSWHQALQIRQVSNERALHLKQRLDGQNRELETQRELTSRLISHVPAAVAYVDPDGYYRWNNLAHCQMLRMSAQDILHRHVTAVSAQVGNAILANGAIARETRSLYQTHGLQIGPDTAPASYWDLSFVPMFDEAGLYAGMLLLGTDATHRLKLVHLQQDQLAHLRQMDRHKDEFIGIVSHELRTPLSAAYGALKLISSGVFSSRPEKNHELLAIAIRNTERLIGLTNDILDVTRLDMGHLSIDCRPLEVSAILRSAVEAVQLLAEEAGVKVGFQSPALSVMADPQRIAQVLGNLLTNAIKFSPAGGQIGVTAQPDDQFVRFAVQDEGRGIPPDKLELIFERFQQVDASDSREKGGTGLGLAICRSIIEQHGGKIWAESSCGQGSTFYFTLPTAALALSTHGIEHGEGQGNLA